MSNSSGMEGGGAGRAGSDRSELDRLVVRARGGDSAAFVDLMVSTESYRRGVKNRQLRSVKFNTSNWIRFQIEANREEHLVVFSIGSDGEFNLIRPDFIGQKFPRPDTRPSQPWSLDGLEITDPPGIERIDAISSQRSVHQLFNEQQLAQLESTAYQGPRGIRKVREALDSHPVRSQVAILELGPAAN